MLNGLDGYKVLKQQYVVDDGLKVFKRMSVTSWGTIKDIFQSWKEKEGKDETTGKF